MILKFIKDIGNFLGKFEQKSSKRVNTLQNELKEMVLKSEKECEKCKRDHRNFRKEQLKNQSF